MMNLLDKGLADEQRALDLKRAQAAEEQRIRKEIERLTLEIVEWFKKNDKLYSSKETMKGTHFFTLGRRYKVHVYEWSIGWQIDLSYFGQRRKGYGWDSDKMVDDWIPLFGLEKLNMIKRILDKPTSQDFKVTRDEIAAHYRSLPDNEREAMIVQLCRIDREGRMSG